ncbi:MAG: GNAT family N-acetyltransferase [Polaribacter sp.]|nr:GNAT family N-acetyltransferase [Polaribacter sp.]
MNLTTRPASLKDLKTLLEFEQGVISFERPFDPTLKEKTSYYDIPGLINSSEVLLLVAVLGTEIIASGYARIEVAKPYLKHQQYAYLGFMFVALNHRGKGVNGIVLEALKTWVLSKNISEVRLDVYNDNPSAIRAYEKAGFKKHLINMRKGLST